MTKKNKNTFAGSSKGLQVFKLFDEITKIIINLNIIHLLFDKIEKTGNNRGFCNLKKCTVIIAE